MGNLTRVAVATTTRAFIDDRFGEADEFAVYEMGESGPYFLETRVVEQYGRGEYVIEDKRDVSLRAVADCDVLFATRVEDSPRQQLLDVGIEPIDIYAQEPIDSSLDKWWRAHVEVQIQV